MRTTKCSFLSCEHRSPLLLDIAFLPGVSDKCYCHALMMNLVPALFMINTNQTKWWRQIVCYVLPTKYNRMQLCVDANERHGQHGWHPCIIQHGILVCDGVFCVTDLLWLFLSSCNCCHLHHNIMMSMKPKQTNNQNNSLQWKDLPWWTLPQLVPVNEQTTILNEKNLQQLFHKANRNWEIGWTPIDFIML